MRSALLFALLATSACGISPPPSQFPSAADAIARMKATYRCARGVKGDAKIDSFSERGRVRGKVLMFASRINRLRVDLLSPPPFNSVIATLTTDGDHFSFNNVRERKFYEGPATACNIARLTEVSLEAHVLVSLLGGQAPLLVHRDADLQMEWSKSGYYIVHIPSTRGAEEELHLTPTPDDFQKPWSAQRLRVLDVRVAQQGIELYHARMDDHAWSSTPPPQVDPDGIDPPIPPSGPSCTVEIPHKIQIDVRESGADVLFRYEDVKPNPPLPAGAFTQPVPDGSERVHVDCGS